MTLPDSTLTDLLAKAEAASSMRANILDHMVEFHKAANPSVIIALVKALQEARGEAEWLKTQGYIAQCGSSANIGSEG